MEYGYIYKTTNLINGRIYIGQNKGTFNIHYLGSGKILREAIKKYGKKNFRLEVIAYATTFQMLNGLEQKYIYEYRQVFGKEFLYNIADGGLAFIGDEQKGRIFSKETRYKISQNRIDRYKKQGFLNSEETRKKMSIASQGKGSGRKLSDITKKKISEARKRKMRELGYINSQETRERMRKTHIMKAKVQYA